MTIAGDIIADFDAASLRLDGKSPTMLRIVAVSDARLITNVQATWDRGAVDVARSQFHWPAVANRAEAAIILVAWNEDSQTAHAMLQVRLPWIVPCDTGMRGPQAYISFIETAPWNQPEHPQRRFKGLGSLLIACASEISAANGLDGRLGLHSVTSATQFYLKMGFQPVDCLNEYKELYFELDAPAAVLVRTKGLTR